MAEPYPGPIVVVWDNLNSHVSATMTELAAARDWLSVCQLPPYAHELKSRRVGVVAPEKVTGQPGQTQPHPADRPGEDPAQADAVPARLPAQVIQDYERAQNDARPAGYRRGSTSSRTNRRR